MAVDDGNHPERRFIGRIGDQVIAYTDEAKRATGQVNSPVSLIWERHQVSDCFQNVLTNATRGCGTIGGDVFPNLSDIERRFRVEAESLVH